MLFLEPVRRAAEGEIHGSGGSAVGEASMCEPGFRGESKVKCAGTFPVALKTHRQSARGFKYVACSSYRTERV